MATHDESGGSDIQKRFNELPQDIRDLITGSDMTNIIRKIGGDHGLHIDQIGKLEEEASLLMLGITPQKNFADALENHMQIEAGTAKALEIQIRDELLVKVRESLHKMYPDSGEVSAESKIEHPTTPVVLVKSVIHNEVGMPSSMGLLNKQQVVPPLIPSTPAITPAPALITPTTVAKSNPYDSVDEKLHATTQNLAQKVDVAPPIQNAPHYKSDPYLEPIE